MSFKKRFLTVFCTMTLLAGMLGGGSVAAATEYVVVNNGFSTGNDGVKIPKGSIVEQLESGITNVFSSDGQLLFKTNDANATSIITPQGEKIATHVFSVPNDVHIRDTGNSTVIIKNGEVLFTVIEPKSFRDKSKVSRLTVPSAGNGWIEDAHDTGLRIDESYCKWIVPSFAQNPSSSAIDFLFSGIEPWAGDKIIQPVLEWNQGGSHAWTGRAWFAQTFGNDYAASSIDCSVNDQMEGWMYQIVPWEEWRVQIKNLTTGETSGFYVETGFGHDGIFGLRHYWTLEGYNIYYNSDVPGDTVFTNIALKHDDSTVSYSCSTTVNSNNFPNLTGLSVSTSGSTVTLNTNN